MAGSLVAPDVLAAYAAAAVREVPGVHALVGRHEGAKIASGDGRVGVEVHVSLEWGANAGEVGAAIQANVTECLARMAAVRPDTVDVVIDEWRSASPA